MESKSVGSVVTLGIVMFMVASNVGWLDTLWHSAQHALSVVTHTVVPHIQDLSYHMDPLLLPTGPEKTEKQSLLKHAWNKLTKAAAAVKFSIERRLIKPLEKKVLVPLFQTFQFAQDYVRAKNQALLNNFKQFMQLSMPDERKRPLRVRTGSALNSYESAYLDLRTQKTKSALEAFLERSLDERVPRIAFCGSGGGYRAMLATLGFMLGAQRIGLLDGVTYISALSGSTWTVAPHSCMGVPIEQFRDYLVPRLKDGLTAIVKKDQLGSVRNAFMNKIAHDQLITSIDIYGALLANRLLKAFDPNRHGARYSMAVDKIKDGSSYLPICTAVMDVEPYEWLEFTPYEVGSPYLNTYVPTWAFGRKFIDGTGQDLAPEQSLGFLLGIFGSAFEAGLRDLINHKGESIASFSPLLFDVLTSLKKTRLNKFRALPAAVKNFTRDMNESPIAKDKHIRLLDAGLDFNLPLPPLIRPERNVDIIVVFDASGGGNMGHELGLAEQYARGKNLPFPSIDLTGVDQRRVSVFEDPDPKVPTVVYMPLVNEDDAFKVGGASFDPQSCMQGSFCGTTNFSYDDEQAAQLMGLTEFNMIASRRAIRQAILNKIGKK